MLTHPEHPVPRPIPGSTPPRAWISPRKPHARDTLWFHHGLPVFPCGLGCAVPAPEPTWHRLWYKYCLVGREKRTLPYLMPSRIKRVSDMLTDVTWNDGHFSSYPSWYLRENCPCALCVEEFTGRRMIRQGSIPSHLKRNDLSLVGNYALRFAWDDGHDTGIYTFDYLRSICPCAQCLPEGLEEPPPAAPPQGSFEA
jgi:DUF971 family protein